MLFLAFWCMVGIPLFGLALGEVLACQRKALCTRALHPIYTAAPSVPLSASATVSTLQPFPEHTMRRYVRPLCRSLTT